MNLSFSLFTSNPSVPIHLMDTSPIMYNIIDLFTDTAAILISIVSDSYYGMPRGQIHINLPPEHPIMSFEIIEIKVAAVSVKRSIEMK